MSIIQFAGFRRTSLRKAHRYITAISVIPLLVYTLMGLRSSFAIDNVFFDALTSDTCSCVEHLPGSPRWIAVIGASMTAMNILTGLFLFSPKRSISKIIAK